MVQYPLPHSTAVRSWRTGLSSPVPSAFVVLCLGVLTAACARTDAPLPEPTLPDGVEAISLLGDTLRRPAFADSTRARLRADLVRAESALAATLAAARAGGAAPRDVHDAYIWVGRRQAYLGQYRDAITTYSEGIAAPEGQYNPRLFRHRGHRYITTRRLDSASADFERAATLIEGQPDEVEPDGAPNALGIPTSTLQFNIWYHLGLVRYLRGDWLGALDAYERCRAVSAMRTLRPKCSRV
jgi:tetratricopeptide (TPR) repeat protein